ncbi:MAG: hypothetical protein LBQ88_07605 [Treponema sp.]|jgi:hypothetical protein|nr:hypothetical protein [Treponema sp.]
MNITPKENALIAYQHKQPAWIPCFYTDISMIQAYPQMERYCGLESGPDLFGVDWTFVPSINAPMPTPGKEMFDDIAKWRDYVKVPDLDAIDWEKQAEIDINTDFMALVNGAGLVRRQDGKTAYDDNKLVVCMVINGMFERMHSFMGFENALMALLTEPEACSEFFGAVADYKIKYFRKIAKYYKVDVINAHDDYGMNDRMFMALDTWRSLIKPHLKRMVDACHELGIIYQHHSCGYIEPLMDDFAEIGIDAIDTLQACNANLKKIKDRLGSKITFCGGFDNMGVLDIIGIDDESVRREYRRVIDSLAPGGSYVIYPIGGVFGFVPVFLDEHFKYGMGFYQKHGK